MEVADDHGLNALHFAAKNGSTDCLNILIKHNACVNTLTKRGESPVLLAARLCKLDCMKLLLQHGANPNLANYIG